MAVAAELIVDFPPQRNHKVVRFAEPVATHLHIVDRHEHKNELWYTKTEYNSVKRNTHRDDLQIRANDSASTFENDSGFWIGIAHLLTPACVLEVKACRLRCKRAVLAEQASQSPSASFRCEDIALASLSETGKAALRARRLGKLHEDSIRE